MLHLYHKHGICMLGTATVPVSGLLLQKSTLYPSFLLLFSLLCLTCCFSLCAGVWNVTFFIFTSFALLPFDACCAYFFFPPHHGHYDWSPYCCCNFPILFLFYLDSLAFFLLLFVFFSLSHPGLCSTCFVAEFVVRSFYLLYFTFRLGQ